MLNLCITNIPRIAWWFNGSRWCNHDHRTADSICDAGRTPRSPGPPILTKPRAAIFRRPRQSIPSRWSGATWNWQSMGGGYSANGSRVRDRMTLGSNLLDNYLLRSAIPHGCVSQATILSLTFKRWLERLEQGTTLIQGLLEH